MPVKPGFLAGVVEGFYGRPWSWPARRDTARFLPRLGLNAYLYCPKSDPWLRKRWAEPWPASHGEQLRTLAETCGEAGVHWGVGLSPFALYRDYGRAEKEALRAKLALIDDLGGSLLGVLFDDMPGDCQDLAARQAEIVSDIRHWSCAEQLLVCPTYYSFDPQLERYFGAMPEGYWEALGAALDAACRIFWTGNAVCSSAISAADIEAINARLGRRVCLWDNYPVNDGATASQYLHLAPLSGRDSSIEALLSGHFCNPMNQACLSLHALGGLSTLYGMTPPALETCVGAPVARLLERDFDLFQSGGLAAMDGAQRESLSREYGRLDYPAAREVSEWLAGEYRFDPACLTE